MRLMTAGVTATLVVSITLLSAAPERQRQQGQPCPAAPLGLDHVPVAVANLDAASARFRALGFALKPGRPHANGIRNAHIKFADGTEVELITAPVSRDDLTASYRRHLQVGDGPAFLALYAPSLAAAVRTLKERGFPVDQDGTLAIFPPRHPLRYLFFGGRNRSPTDRPEHFAHANTARSLLAVWLAADDPATELRALAALGAVPCGRRPLPPLFSDARVVPLTGGALYLLPREARHVKGRPIVGMTVRVENLDAALKIVSKAGVGRPSVSSLGEGRSVFLAPPFVNGFWLELREIGRAPDF
jgi:hypothetical protein